MNYLTEFIKETFNSWLEKQPNDRKFDYMDCQNCLVASFLKEELNQKNVGVGGFDFTLNKETENQATYFIPEFVIKLLDEKVVTPSKLHFTIQDLKS